MSWAAFELLEMLGLLVPSRCCLRGIAVVLHHISISISSFLHIIYFLKLLSWHSVSRTASVQSTSYGPFFKYVQRPHCSSMGFSSVDLSILESRCHRILIYKDNVISNVRCGPALFLGPIDGAGGEDMAMKQDGVGSDLYRSTASLVGCRMSSFIFHR